MKKYAGIGSRLLPDTLKPEIRKIAELCARAGLLLRSGGAVGCDSEFENACDLVGGIKEIFLPWKEYNNNPSPLYSPSSAAFDIAKEFHPAWHTLNMGAKKLHARNVHILLGTELDDPVDFVACWTGDGAETKTTRETGGTGQAIRIAVHYNKEVFNINNPFRLAELHELITGENE